jgi:hypothetical protein
MPLFGGNKRAALGGLTKGEQKRRDALDIQIAARVTGGGQLSEEDALSEILNEKCASESGDFLWPLIIGWRLTNKRGYTAAIESFKEATSRDATQVRCYCGAGLAYLQAGMAAQSMGSGVTAVQVPPGMTTEALFRESARAYSTAVSLTTDKSELAQLQDAVDTVERALATTVRKAPN